MLHCFHQGSYGQERNKGANKGGQKTDDQHVMDYLKIVEDKFPQVKNGGLRYFYLDACFEEDDEDEEQAFNKAMRNSI